jgi:transposase
MAPPPAQLTRFVAIDVHKDYVMVGAVDAQQQIVLPPRRLSMSEFEDWAPKRLTKTDSVVLEATTNAWHLVDQLQPYAGAVTVAHPLLVKLISAARVKTDTRDTINLARLLAAKLIPQVWVPPEEVRELRALLAHRRRLISNRTQARNRLHSVLHRHNLVPPSGDLFAPSMRDWWQALALPFSERLRIRQDLGLLETLEPLIAEVDTELVRLSTAEPWADQVPFLIHLPGIGVHTAMTVLSAIGDITRFPSASQLVGYSGLGAGVHDSGQTHRGGTITKQGRRDLRAAMVEAAWVAVRHHPFWQAEFVRLAKRRGKCRAIVAIVRKLLVVVWHVLSKREVDRHADVELVARKLFTWASRCTKEQRQGQSRTAFVRRHLNRLGLGSTLKAIRYGGEVFHLPPIREELTTAS